jgi:hypothetical protein
MMYIFPQSFHLFCCEAISNDIFPSGIIRISLWREGVGTLRISMAIYIVRHAGIQEFPNLNLRSKGGTYNEE